MHVLFSDQKSPNTFQRKFIWFLMCVDDPKGLNLKTLACYRLEMVPPSHVFDPVIFLLHMVHRNAGKHHGMPGSILSLKAYAHGRQKREPRNRQHETRRLVLPCALDKTESIVSRNTTDWKQLFRETLFRQTTCLFRETKFIAFVQSTLPSSFAFSVFCFAFFFLTSVCRCTFSFSVRVAHLLQARRHEGVRGLTPVA